MGKKKYLHCVACFVLIVSIIATCFTGCNAEPTSSQSSELTPSSELSSSIAPSSDSSLTFTLNVPNFNFTIAPGRDFYVLGSIDGEVPENMLLIVSLYRDSDSKLVRRVFTDTKDNKDGLHYNYPEITLVGTSDIQLVRDSLMPDLVYDGSDLETFKDQFLKCYYDDHNFTATFNGGRYTFDVNPIDENGVPYEDIQEGEHTVVVEAFSTAGVSIGRNEFHVTIGITADKFMSRFSPSAHYENLLAFAEETGHTVYIDDFSGLFYDVPFLVNYPQEMQIWINRKWQFMNGIEYEKGRVHFLIYNVSPTSTTWKVELATIQNTQGVDDPNRLVSYFYDIGDMNVGGVIGKFEQFPLDERMHLYRVDYQTGNSQENYINTNDLLNIESDFDLSDGVTALTGEVISLYGVVKPIQVDPSDLIFDETQSEFTINNRISTVQYTFTGDNVLYSENRDVGLVRSFVGGSEYLSLLEFKHDFEVQEAWAGKEITVVMEAFDTHGNLIDGASNRFELNVQTEAGQKAA